MRTSSVLINDYRMKSCALIRVQRQQVNSPATSIWSPVRAPQIEILTSCHTFSQAVYRPLQLITFCRIFAATPVVWQLVCGKIHE